VSTVRLTILVALAMVAFAGNSLICRLALKHTAIDAASFTTLRLLSGATMLWLIVRFAAAERDPPGRGLVLRRCVVRLCRRLFLCLHHAPGRSGSFAPVWCRADHHDRLRAVAGREAAALQMLGLVCAVGGCRAHDPRLFSAPVEGSVLMLGAGVGLGVLFLVRERARDPTGVTAGNFLRTVPFAIGLSMVMIGGASLDRAGIGYALVSGALASGMGYVIWYATASVMTATSAAVVQLTVPIIAAAGGIVFSVNLSLCACCCPLLPLLAELPCFFHRGSVDSNRILTVPRNGYYRSDARQNTQIIYGGYRHMKRILVLLIISTVFCSACTSTRWVRTPVAKEYDFTVTLEQFADQGADGAQIHDQPRAIDLTELKNSDG